MKGLSFSLKRAVGISGLKTKIARKTGIPTTKQGLERKIGQSVLSVFTGEKKTKINKYTTIKIIHYGTSQFY